MTLREMYAEAVAMQLETRGLPDWQVELAREVIAEGTDAELHAVYFVGIRVADLSQPTREQIEAGGVSPWTDRAGESWLLALEARPEVLDQLEALSASGVGMKSLTLLEWCRMLEPLAARLGVIPPFPLEFN
jgi:hypothetical protein